MRRSRTWALLGLVAMAVPVHAAAGTTSGSGHLALTPSVGVPGSHFTATFDYAVAACDQYSVDFSWDNEVMLGSASDASTGQSCEVSIQAVVPSNQSAPGTAHTVSALAHPRNVAAGGGPGPSADATFQIPDAPAPTTTSSSSHTTQSSTGSTTTTSRSTTTTTTTGTAVQQSSAAPAAVAQASGGSTSTTPDPSPGTDGARVPPSASIGPRTSGPGWVIAAVLGALMAAAAVDALIRRSRRRRTPR